MKNPFWYLIRSVNKFLIFLFFVISVQSFGQESHVRYFYSLNEKMPLAYLRLLTEDGKQGFLTDLSGKVNLPQAENIITNSLNISGYGINDTLISIKQILSRDTIFIKVKEFELSEVIISSSMLNELKIGDSSAEIREVSKPITPDGELDAGFYRYTIRVKIPKKKNLILDEIKFYVSNILNEKVDVSLRILYPEPENRIVPGKSNSITEFAELLNENKIIAISTHGWQKIQFEDSVQIPKGIADLFIVFDLLDTTSSSQFALTDQSISKDIDIGFYMNGGKIGVFQKEQIHPAIELTFLN